MIPAVLLVLVLLAMYGFTMLVLSAGVALAWNATLKRTLASNDLLLLRLVPAGGGLLFVLTIVLPAFLGQEPRHPHEAVGPLLLLLAALSVLFVGIGIWRGWRACAGARSLLRRWGPVTCRVAASGQEVNVVDLTEPLVAVIGGWRPSIVAAESVISACSTEEFQQVIAHEGAHVCARDNLKQLLLIASPDVLGWTRMGADLTLRWQAATELEADERATDNDPRKRVALAAALIKVARALGAVEHTRPVLSMPIASDDVEARVRRLLAPPSPLPRGAASAKTLALCVLLVGVAALPFYPWVQELIEALVRFGL